MVCATAKEERQSSVVTVGKMWPRQIKDDKHARKMASTIMPADSIPTSQMRTVEHPTIRPQTEMYDGYAPLSFKVVERVESNSIRRRLHMLPRRKYPLVLVQNKLLRPRRLPRSISTEYYNDSLHDETS